MGSLTLLVTWEILDERNARAFHNKKASMIVILEKIKKESKLWVCVGAKRLSEIMPRE
jgi:hypothetical protein